MPNWCFSTVNVNASKKSIETIVKELETATSSNPLKADFGDKWLGNLLLHIGWTPEDVLSSNTVRCRGSIIDYAVNDEGTMITLETETAWAPMVRCIKEFCDHYVEDAVVTYTAEENGCQLYWTNDEDYKDVVYIDWYNDGSFPDELEEVLQGCCDAPIKDVIAEFNDYLGRTYDVNTDDPDKTLSLLEDELCDKVQEISEDCYIACHRYHYVPIEETE